MDLPTIPAEQAAEILNNVPSVEDVRRLERHISDFPQVDLHTKHLIHGGMYARTILIPAGTILTGALTRADNISVMVGDITVTTEAGVKRLIGFHVLPAEAGVKRAGVAHKDTWWTTLIPTEETDLSLIEKHFTDEAEGLQTNRKDVVFLEG